MTQAGATAATGGATAATGGATAATGGATAATGGGGASVGGGGASVGGGGASVGGSSQTGGGVWKILEGKANKFSNYALFENPTVVILTLIALIATTDIAIDGGTEYFGSEWGPHKGEEFKDTGKEKISEIREAILAAAPRPDEWSGPAAEAFLKQIEQLDQALFDMSLQEDTMTNAISDHAKKLKITHIVNAACIGLLIATLATLAFCEADPTGFASRVTMLAVVVTVCGAFVGTHFALVASSYIRRNDLKRAEGEYELAGNRSRLDGSGPIIDDTSRALETRVSSFTNDADNSDMVVEMPSLASILAKSDNEVPSFVKRFLAGEGGSASDTSLTRDGDDTDGETDPDATPSTGFNMPAARVRIQEMAERTGEITSQIGKISEDLSKGMAVMTQATTQVDSMSSMIQDWAPEPAPAAPPPPPAPAPPAPLPAEQPVAPANEETPADPALVEEVPGEAEGMVTATGPAVPSESLQNSEPAQSSGSPQSLAGAAPGQVGQRAPVATVPPADDAQQIPELTDEQSVSDIMRAL